DLHLLSATYPDESVVWNPCRLGNVSQLQTKFYQSGVYHEPFYAKACELALLHAFEALANEPSVCLIDLALEVKNRSSDGTKNITQGLALDLENLARSAWSELLCCHKPTRHR